jgi:hypothetical protein
MAAGVLAARWVADPPREAFGVLRHATVTPMSDVQQTWRRFDGMVAGTKAFKACACVYVIADPKGTPLYIGGTIVASGQRVPATLTSLTSRCVRESPLRARDIGGPGTAVHG